jgi:glycosyltransferase involved in cell wall biosynthesis/GT2 family glycosyltransferase
MIDPRRPDFSNTPVSKHRPLFAYRAESVRKPVISIVTPFYNTGEEFHETAGSVVGQSLQEFEWLIVNDGTDDDRSIEILDSYRSSDPRIRVIDHQTNRGLGPARNTGFREAATEFVLCLDSDDLLEPTAAEKWFWFLFTHEQFAAVNGFSVWFEGQPRLHGRGFDMGREVLMENHVDVNCMVRRSVHREVGGRDESRPLMGVEDWDFWLRCADHGHWGATIPEFLAWYRTRPVGDDPWNYRETLADLKKELRRRYPKLWDAPFPQPGSQSVQIEELAESIPSENVLEKSRRRLLMIVPFLIMGGSERFNIQLIEGLVARGWEVTLATTEVASDPWAPEFTRLTPDVFQMHHFLQRSDYPRFLSYLIGSRRPDAVMVSNSQLGYQLLPYLRSKHPETTFVDYNHYVDAEWRQGGFVRDSIDYQEMLDLKLVNSANIRDWMIERGGKDPIQVVYIGVDAENWAPNDEVRRAIRGEAVVQEDLPVILYACRIVPEKRPELFALVLRELDRRGLDFRAWVAGDGRAMPDLKRLLADYGLESKVRVDGAVSFDRMRKLMIAADIFLLPSALEGIALTVYEAMSTGCAVVAADVGGQSELVTSDSGVLVPRVSEDEELQEYVSALERLITDPSERRRMGEAARKRVLDGFTLEDMRNKFVACIDEAQTKHIKNPKLVLSQNIAKSHAVFAVNEVPIEAPEALRESTPNAIERGAPKRTNMLDRVMFSRGGRTLLRLKRVLKTLAGRILRTYRIRARRALALPDPLWGNMRRFEPISATWGWDRGTPIDRYWIDQFLDRYRHRIRGAVLEVHDRRYAERFGDGRVERSSILDIDPLNVDADIVADLGEPDSLPAGEFDCIILTQILQLIPDPKIALQNAWRALKPGGSLFISHPVITRIDDFDGWREYWRATPMGLDALLRSACPDGSVETAQFGNLFSSIAFLAGQAAEELTADELNLPDQRFVALACGCVAKPQ